MKAIKDLIVVVLSIVILFFPVTNLVNFIYQSQRINTNIVAPLEQASTYQDANDMIPFFEKAISFIDGNGLDKGNTCLFFSTTPQCELSNFHRKLDQDVEILNEVKDEPISSYEVTNALTRIHQSLYKRGEKGESITIPDFVFAIRWGTSSILITKLIEWFSGLVGFLFVVVLAALAED